MSFAYALESDADVARIAAQHFGITTFRPGQRALIDAALAGRDALGILPTGGGKSLTFQLPSLFFDKTVVVVSPLLALMADQASKLDRLQVPAARVESSRGKLARAGALRQAARGDLDIVYVTPEQLTRADVIAALAPSATHAGRGVSLFVVDEAHCISSWGHDFRPAYLGLRHAAAALGRPPILALTATATEDVRADIALELGLREPTVVHVSSERPNLHIEVVRAENDQAKLESLHVLLRDWPAQGIVYGATINTVERVANALRTANVVGGVAHYHGELSTAARTSAQDAFMSGRARVLVATKAFGMGVDKPDVRFVVHWEMPDSLEAYAQEIGRAGRDGRPAVARLLYRRADRRVWDFFHRTHDAPEDDVRALVRAVFAMPVDAPVDEEFVAQEVALSERKLVAFLWELEHAGVITRSAHGFARSSDEGLVEANVAERLVRRMRERRAREKARLEEMIAFAEGTGCRTARLLAHFGEAPGSRCDRCDACGSRGIVTR